MTTHVLAVLLTTIALWVPVALVLATLIGRMAATGEHHHQMDALYRGVRWNL